jgi:hypothetical protein
MPCLSTVRNQYVVLAILALCLFALCVGGCGGGSVPPASLVGTWGGKNVTSSIDPATLTVTAANASLARACGQNMQVSQALQPDASGNFSVSGTYYDPLATGHTVRLTGSVSGQIMTLTVTYTDSGAFIGTYKLMYGQQAPPFTGGGCPG